MLTPGLRIPNVRRTLLSVQEGCHCEHGGASHQWNQSIITTEVEM